MDIVFCVRKLYKDPLKTEVSNADLKKINALSLRKLKEKTIDLPD